MFDVLIFADTRRSVLGLLGFFFLILLHHKTQFCDGYKEKVHQVALKNPAMQKVSPIKVLLLNVTYQEAAYTEVKIKTSTI